MHTSSRMLVSALCCSVLCTTKQPASCLRGNRLLQSVRNLAAPMCTVDICVTRRCVSLANKFLTAFLPHLSYGTPASHQPTLSSKLHKVCSMQVSVHGCLWQVARLAAQARRLQGQLHDFLPSQVPPPQPMHSHDQAGPSHAGPSHTSAPQSDPLAK